MRERVVAGRNGRWDGGGLVSVTWLAANLDLPELRVFDTTVFLRSANPGPFRVESGHAAYKAEHIPGAAFLDLAADFSDQSSGLNFTLPPRHKLAEAFASAGIEDDAVVVLYSSETPMWATRFWWMLRASGFSRVAVLDGGLAAWRSKGYPVEEGEHHYLRATSSPEPKIDAWADQQAVLAAIGDPATCTLSALPSDIYRGVDETHWGRRGRISGSCNVPFATLLDDQGRYLDEDELKRRFEPTGVFDADRAICYCGGGISATMIALALVRLGHASVAVYDGSMAEWSRNPALPMESD